MPATYYLAEVCLVESEADGENSGLMSGHSAELFVEGLSNQCALSFVDSQIKLGNFMPNETRVVSLAVIKNLEYLGKPDVCLWENKPFLIRSMYSGRTLAYGRVISERGW